MAPALRARSAGSRRRGRCSAAVWVALGPLLIAGPAFAHGAATEPMPPAAIPPSPTVEGAAAQRILAELDAKVRGPDAKVIAEPMQRARQALDRARGARASGDLAHGRMLDALALEWAETARELDRAAAVEQRATNASRKARELVTQSERARTLLEDTQARRQRAAAELERIEAEARDSKRAAASPEAKPATPKRDAPTKKADSASDAKATPAPGPAGSTEPAGAKKGSPR